MKVDVFPFRSRTTLSDSLRQHLELNESFDHPLSTKFNPVSEIAYADEVNCTTTELHDEADPDEFEKEKHRRKIIYSVAIVSFVVMIIILTILYNLLMKRRKERITRTPKTVKRQGSPFLERDVDRSAETLDKNSDYVMYSCQHVASDSLFLGQAELQCGSVGCSSQIPASIWLLCSIVSWEPEGRYCHRLCTAIAPFWFSSDAMLEYRGMPRSHLHVKPSPMSHVRQF